MAATVIPIRRRPHVRHAVRRPDAYMEAITEAARICQEAGATAAALRAAAASAPVLGKVADATETLR